MAVLGAYILVRSDLGRDLFDRAPDDGLSAGAWSGRRLCRAGAGRRRLPHAARHDRLQLARRSRRPTPGGGPRLCLLDPWRRRACPGAGFRRRPLAVVLRAAVRRQHGLARSDDLDARHAALPRRPFRPHLRSDQHRHGPGRLPGRLARRSAARLDRRLRRRDDPRPSRRSRWRRPRSARKPARASASAARGSPNARGWRRGRVACCARDRGRGCW